MKTERARLELQAGIGDDGVWYAWLTANEKIWASGRTREEAVHRVCLRVVETVNAA